MCLYCAHCVSFMVALSHKQPYFRIIYFSDSKEVCSTIHNSFVFLISRRVITYSSLGNNNDDSHYNTSAQSNQAVFFMLLFCFRQEVRRTYINKCAC